MGGSSSKVILEARHPTENCHVAEEKLKELTKEKQEMVPQTQMTNPNLSPSTTILVEKLTEGDLNVKSLVEDQKNAMDQFIWNAKQMLSQSIEKITLNAQASALLAQKGENQLLCFVGPESCGKKMTINALFGERVCKAPDDEEQAPEIQKVGVLPNTNWNVFGIPNAHDKISNLDMETVYLLKAMDLIIITFATDPKAVYNLIRSCDALNVKFICIRNKCDKVDENDDVEKWRPKDLDKIYSAVGKDSPNFRGLFFLSARNKFSGKPNLFDWEKFTQFLQNKEGENKKTEKAEVTKEKEEKIEISMDIQSTR